MNRPPWGAAWDYLKFLCPTCAAAPGKVCVDIMPTHYGSVRRHEPAPVAHLARRRKAHRTTTPTFAQGGEVAGEVARWCARMANEHGPFVRDVEAAFDAPALDWAQALARDQYGPDWAAAPTLGPAPTSADLDRALRWEAGEWPGWARV